MNNIADIELRIAALNISNLELLARLKSIRNQLTSVKSKSTEDLYAKLGSFKLDTIHRQIIHIDNIQISNGLELDRLTAKLQQLRLNINTEDQK